MSTPSQVAANQANSQHSTGPKTEQGKAISCLNNFRYGFTGEFTVLPSEDQEAFDTLYHGLRAEHKAKTVTETILIEKMAQHIWLSRRAMTLQEVTMADNLPMHDKERQFALYLRYQNTNDRGFSKCLNDLLKLRTERRKEQIGFESQKAKEAEELRREADEKRRQHKHEMQIWLMQAEGEHRELKNMALDPSEGSHEARVKRIIAHEKAA